MRVTFLRLERAGDLGPVWVNLAQISSIEPDGQQHALLALANGDEILVAHPPGAILDAVLGETHERAPVGPAL